MKENHPTPEARPPMRKNAKRLTVGGVLLAIFTSLYAVAQPWVRDRYGVELPELVSSQAERSSQVAAQESRKPKPSVQPPTVEGSAKSDLPSGTTNKGPTKSGSTNRGSVENGATKDSVKSPDDKGLLHGILRPLPRDEYISPAGLRYTPGSQEGHRLKHLERHTQDQPTRPGRHGVFSGGMEGALKVLDEAYQKAKQGGRGVQKEEDEGRVIYTVDLRRKIGFIGGEEGNRRNKPTAFRVRMILDGDRVITAYPL